MTMPLSAGWLLVGLCFRVMVRGGEDAALSECRESFHRGMSPVGFGGDQLQFLCHNPGGGPQFATLYSASRDATIFLAFSVKSPTGSRGDGQEAENEEALPLSLLRSPGGAVDVSDTQTEMWHSTILELVQRNTVPWCQSIGGNLYVLASDHPVDPIEKGSGVTLLWSALCCATPHGDRTFSFGVLSKQDKGLRVLSIGALEEELQVGSLFPGGCEDASGGGDWEDTLAVFREQLVEKFGGGLQAGEMQVNKAQAQVDEAQAGKLQTQSSGNTAAQGTEAESVEAELSSQMENGTESLTLYLLSTSFYLLSAPIHPIVSKLAQIPGQVSYMAQEELGVLSALPYDTFLVFNNVVSDAAGGVTSAGSLMGKVVGGCASLIYSSTSALVEVLVNSCMEGVVGMGVLAGDGVGIFGGIVNKTWSASTLISGRVLEQSGGYVSTVTSELGSQLTSMGAGLGNLLVRGGRGVIGAVRIVGVVLGGTVGHVLETVMEAFGKE